ncbi:Mitochondrial substrate carrier family protein X [Gracilariopsis chorda]|uniref:Mitochondrial substrate carrier family protein X n=1 Tax=Gracilariopsis chorda TaxID=448386 RepID=A0A2V3IFR6_9FLOR|nr:Mitochondrial substrate carrier family protein X [Gracilariopsis chorda]|eukprot:PXF40924.1 Mitochondrial substrate carrier family protein X [Gracilariopsis chorda]
MASQSSKPSPKHSANKNILQNILFGGVAGVIGQSSVYPLYTIKTHLQRYPAHYNNFVQAGAKIYRQTGLRSLYRGLGPALIGVFPEKAIKLSVNDYLTAVLSRPDGSISVPMAMLAGGGAGLSQVVATNPMEVLMINMHTSNRSMAQLVSQLGISGLYKGASATLLRDIPFSMLFFSMNTFMRAYFTDSNGNLPMSKVFIAGILSGSTAAAASTPADVIKTHLQYTSHSSTSPSKSNPKLASASHSLHSQPPSSTSVPSRPLSSSAAPPQYQGIAHCAKSIWASRGISGFFSGVGPRVLTISPLFGVTLFFYDIQRRLKESGKL